MASILIGPFLPSFCTSCCMKECINKTSELQALLLVHVSPAIIISIIVHAINQRGCLLAKCLSISRRSGKETSYHSNKVASKELAGILQ